MARPYLGGSSAGLVDVTADKTIGRSDAGKIMSLNSTSALTVTLPTDANIDIGFSVKFIVQTANDNAYTIKTGDIADSGGDDFVGGLILSSATAGYANVIIPAADDCNIVLDANLADCGGLKGSWVELVKIASNEWMVSGCVYSADADTTGAALFTDSD